jgi:hypothetical protein
MASFRALADKARVDPWLCNIPVYYGINWFPPRGKRFGFQTELLTAGIRTSLLRWHFRILLYASSPGYEFSNSNPIKPHVFWLTRRQLIKHFTGEKAEDNVIGTLKKK